MAEDATEVAVRGAAAGARVAAVAVPNQRKYGRPVEALAAAAAAATTKPVKGARLLSQEPPWHSRSSARLRRSGIQRPPERTVGRPDRLSTYNGGLWLSLSAPLSGTFDPPIILTYDSHSTQASEFGYGWVGKYSAHVDAALEHAGRAHEGEWNPDSLRQQGWLR